MSEYATGRPGLIFTGGEGPLPWQCRGIVEDARAAAEAEPLIVAADSGLLLAERAGIVPDWIIGDMDSLGEEAENRLAAYPPEKIRSFPRDKDYTDTELAFSLLLEKDCKRIWIVGGGGGRIDQLFAIRSLFERDTPPERWVTSREDIRCVEARHNGPSGLKACSEGLVSVFPLGNGPWEAESSGLKWPLDGLAWNRGLFGVSNEAPHGDFVVRAKRGRFMVIAPLPGGSRGEGLLQ